MPLSASEIKAVEQTATQCMMWGAGWKNDGFVAYVKGRKLFSSLLKSSFIKLWAEAESIRSEMLRKEMKWEAKS